MCRCSRPAVQNFNRASRFLPRCFMANHPNRKVALSSTGESEPGSTQICKHMCQIVSFIHCVYWTTAAAMVMASEPESESSPTKSSHGRSSSARRPRIAQRQSSASKPDGIDAGGKIQDVPKCIETYRNHL